MLSRSLPGPFGRPPAFAGAYRQIAAETGVVDATPHRLVTMLYDGFFEAIDLLELAVSEGVPELATAIKTQTQDAVDILRDIQERAESHYAVLHEEMEERG